MDDVNEFTALLTRIGFIAANQRQEITNQGIVTCADLADLSDEEPKAVFDENKNANRRRNAKNQIVLPILAKARLDAIRYEMELRAMCCKPMTLIQIQGIDINGAKALVKQK